MLIKKTRPVHRTEFVQMSENTNHARAIGAKLRAIRKQQHMSLQSLADRANISVSMLSRIETGKAYPSVRSMYNIASALDVPLDYFFPERQRDSMDMDYTFSDASAGLLTASEMREAVSRPASDASGMEPVFFSGSGIEIVDEKTRPMIELKGGVTWSRLTLSPESNVEFLEIAYAPGASSGATMSFHPGREFGLILEGELTLEFGFEVHTLRVGNSVVFGSTIPHRLSNNSDKPMKALWIVLNGKIT